MNLTAAGQKRLRIFRGLCGVSFIYLILAVYFIYTRGAWGWLHPIALIVIGGSPLIYYFILRGNLDERLKQQVLSDLGFKESAAENLIANFTISQRGKMSMDICYLGNWKNHQMHLVEFTITRGSGKNKRHYFFAGLMFETVKTNLPIQVYDKEHPLKPIIMGKISLESQEFNEQFFVTAPDPKNAFYVLDPDTMHDMSMVRRSSNLPISLDVVERQILVYTDNTTYEQFFKKTKLSFEEIMNQAMSSEDLATHREALMKFLDTFYHFFHLLDLKAK